MAITTKSIKKIDNQINYNDDHDLNKNDDYNDNYHYNDDNNDKNYDNDDDYHKKENSDEKKNEKNEKKEKKEIGTFDSISFSSFYSVSSSSSSKNQNASVVIMSMPTRRRTDTVRMIPELVDIGRQLTVFFSEIPKRVVMIASSDLAHTHLECGPYGFSPSAQLFDDACGRWGASLDENELLHIAANLVETALSCGYTPMVVLHGALKQFRAQFPSCTVTPTLLANFHPTYFGMMVSKMAISCPSKNTVSN